MLQIPHQMKATSFIATHGIAIAIYALAIVFQCAVGNVQASWFAFPINIALIAALLLLLTTLWREKRSANYVQALASSTYSVLTLAFIALLCTANAIGGVDIFGSWIFFATTLLLISNLWLVIMRRSYKERNPWRFTLNHLGCLLLIVALYVGAADSTKHYITLRIGEEHNTAYRSNGDTHVLKYSIKLQDFSIAHHANGTPSHYAAVVEVDNTQRTIEVNKPWHRTWSETIYLNNYTQTNNNTLCTLEIVQQPWQHLALLAILMMAVGALLLFVNGSKEKKKAL